jgi:hypothetical protein
VRKYLFNGSLISAIVSSISTIRTGQAGPRDWRFYLSVAASILTLAVAVGTVRAESFEQAKED